MYYNSTNSLTSTKDNNFVDNDYNTNVLYDILKKYCKKTLEIEKNRICKFQHSRTKDVLKNINVGDVYRYMLYGVNNIQSITKDFFNANATLDEILTLKDNWNNNGAKAFSLQHIEMCKRILNTLTFEPFVSPTACGSIQFEYEKDNDDYLEFEIYKDRIEIYEEKANQKPKEFSISSDEYFKLRQMVVDFYE